MVKHWNQTRVTTKLSQLKARVYHVEKCFEHKNEKVIQNKNSNNIRTPNSCWSQ